MRALWAGLAACALASCAAADALEFRALAPQEGAAILTARDDFIENLSPADLSLRLRRPEGGSVDDLAAHYSANVRAWTPQELARLEAMVARHRAAIDALAPWLPPQIGHIKVTTLVEGGFPHTRGAAIVWGEALPGGDADLDTLFFHELFHVLSRHSAARRDELYALIGFAPCTQVSLPDYFAPMHLTNPDAPTDLHVAPAQGREGVYLMPRASIVPTRYDPERPGFGEYFHLVFLEMTRDAEGRCEAVLVHGRTPELPVAAGAAAIAHVTGRNTNYMLHPEEMLADNFAQLMMRRADAPNPEIQTRLAAFLAAAPNETAPAR